MKKLVKKLEDIFAAAFAEAGEFETARQIAEGDGPRAVRRKAEGREGQKGITPPYPSKA